MFQVAGGCGLGALQAAKEQGKWGIGVDNDQGFLGTHVLTSATKKVDSGVFQTIQLGRSKAWKAGVDGVFNVKNGGVGYGKVSTKAPNRVALVESPRQVVEGHRERQGQAAPHRSKTRQDPNDDGRASGPPSAFCAANRRRARRTYDRRRMADRPDVLEMRNITKRFPGIVANDDVELRPRRGRGARAPRRERRGQVDADEHPLRALPPGRGRDLHQGQAGAPRRRRAPRSTRGVGHGAPALHAHPGDDRRREHRARRGADALGRPPRHGRGGAARPRDLRPLRARRRPATRASRTSPSASSSASRS